MRHFDNVKKAVNVVVSGFRVHFLDVPSNLPHLRALCMFLTAKANMEQPTGYLLRCHHFAFVQLLIYCHLLYKGYPSFPVTALDTNARGYRLERFSSIMHCEFNKNVLQGPCIIFSLQLHTSPYRRRHRGCQRILHRRFRLK
ncbi:unnamed protein product [Onchocerca ochengi]|uniref:DSPn domain-containing protein n=1 Tax=Onchocerca ochengi TaxID=42157 RepID=A0A182DYK6_ONCOC|nr:unnamed protein product [Onchocerca ochengi]